MAKSARATRTWFLNLSLVVLGLTAAVLLYAFTMRLATPRADPARDTTVPTHLIGDIIQVEVRNACGVAGIAARTRGYLRTHGFDVVEVGDHTSMDLERSVVIDRIGDLQAAKNVARALGIAEENVIQDIRESYYLDASVLLGKDFESLRPFQ